MICLCINTQSNTNQQLQETRSASSSLSLSCFVLSSYRTQWEDSVPKIIPAVLEIKPPRRCVHCIAAQSQLLFGVVKHPCPSYLASRVCVQHSKTLLYPMCVELFRCLLVVCHRAYSHICEALSFRGSRFCNSNFVYPSRVDDTLLTFTHTPSFSQYTASEPRRQVQAEGSESGKSFSELYKLGIQVSRKLLYSCVSLLGTCMCVLCSCPLITHFLSHLLLHTHIYIAR